MTAQDITEGTAESGQVKSVSTLFTIVEYLRENGPAGVTELSKALGLSKGGVHRYLNTLVEEGYAINNDGTYQLGLQFISIGGSIRQRFPHNNLIEQKVTKLADQTGQRTQFLAEEHGYGIYLYRVRDPAAAQFEAKIGKIVDLHTTAAGKAILAHMPRSEIEEILENRGLQPRTEHTITDPDELFSTLETIREDGYAVNKGELISSVHAVGVPIFDSNDSVLGGMSVSGPSQQIQELVSSGSIRQQLLSVAEEIELEIKYT